MPATAERGEKPMTADPALLARKARARPAADLQDALCGWLRLRLVAVHGDLHQVGFTARHFTHTYRLEESCG